MTFSTQAIVVLICNIILFIGVIISLIIIKKTAKVEIKAVTVLKIIVAFIFFIGYMVIQVWSINCMITGDCHVLTWILVAFIIIGTLAYIGLLIFVVASADAVLLFAQPSSMQVAPIQPMPPFPQKVPPPPPQETSPPTA